MRRPCLCDGFSPGTQEKVGMMVTLKNTLEVIHIIIMSYVGPYEEHHTAIWRL